MLYVPERCICHRPGCPGWPVDEAHWPVAKGMGGRKRSDDLPRIPLHHECHMALHHGAEDVTAAVERWAPAYWTGIGVWEEAMPVLCRYMSRAIYRRRVGA